MGRYLVTVREEFGVKFTFASATLSDLRTHVK